MLEAVEEPVRALVHAPESEAGGFDHLGCVRPGAWRDRDRDLAGDDLRVCRGPAGQADAVLAALADGGGGQEARGGRRRGERDAAGTVWAPDEVTVGVPDREVVPYLSHRLSSLEVPHRYAEGTPMRETRPYRLLDAVAAYLDGRRWVDLAALVRHPDVEPLLDTPDPLGAVDDYFQEHLPGTSRRAPLPTSDHGRELQRVLDGLEERLGLGDLAGRRTTADWMPEVMGLLARVYGREPLDAGRPDHRRLAEACDRLREAAAETRALPEAADTRAPAPAAIRLLLSEIRDGAIPPEPVRPALEMLGWLELHLDDAPVLVITGLSDEAVPGRAGGDPFLPDRLRRDLGLPHDAWRHGRDAYLLEAALRPRAETHLLVARRNGEGDPLRPSRLLLSGSGEELARRVRRLFDDRLPERTGGTPPGTEPAAESRFTAPPEPVVSVSRVPDRLRVTDFRGLLQDPYRFALERLLGLEEQHDRSRELGGLAFGGLAHDVLRRFGESEEAHAGDPGEVRSRLDALLDRAVRRRYGGEALPAVRIQVAQLRVRLGRFARWHASRVREGWRVVATEVGPPAGEGVPFDVEGEPVHLTGRIDRIDRHEARGAWQVLDYKTGESPAHPDDRHRDGRRGERRWVDLQLPLYRHLLPEIARLPDVPDALGNPDGVLELGYVNLSKEGVELALADWTEEEIRDAHRAARQAVMRLREGVFRYDAGEGRSFRDDPLEPLFRGHVRGAGGDAAADGSSDHGGAP
jgi:hypothetical protein